MPVEIDDHEQPKLGVAMFYHDDWLLNVLLTDGRVYTFNTELWPAHLEGWDRVVEEGKFLATALANGGHETWGLDAIPETIEQFKKAMDLVCRYTSDVDFGRFVRSFL